MLMYCIHSEIDSDRNLQVVSSQRERDEKSLKIEESLQYVWIYMCMWKSRDSYMHGTRNPMKKRNLTVSLFLQYLYTHICM